MAAPTSKQVTAHMAKAGIHSKIVEATLSRLREDHVVRAAFKQSNLTQRQVRTVLGIAIVGAIEETVKELRGELPWT